MRVHLTDAPGDYDHLYIDVQGVEVHTNKGGWQTLTGIQTGVFDLLEFTNGMDTVLGSGSLPAGKVSEMRLILGPNNTVVVDSTSYPLATPSAMQSGLKFKLHADITGGVTYDVWIDFDAGRSVVETGSGSYILKPVIRTYTTPTSGAISGMVDPPIASPYVMAVAATDTFGTIADSTGYFLIHGVPAGTYTVYFDNTNGYQDKTVTGVSVVNGVVTQMGTLTMVK